MTAELLVMRSTPTPDVRHLMISRCGGPSLLCAMAGTLAKEHIAAQSAVMDRNDRRSNFIMNLHAQLLESSGNDHVMRLRAPCPQMT
jgi:hypothetical protein